MKRIPLTELLTKLGPDDARMILMVLVEGVISLLKKGEISIERSEQIVFNLDVLEFCMNIKDSDVQWIIEYGMELRSVRKLVGIDEMTNALAEIQSRLSHLNLSSIV